MSGCKVIYVDCKNTSSMCPMCGNTDRTQRHSEDHFFQCNSCGFTHDDDVVGAMNIRARGMKALSLTDEDLDINSII